jgi:glycosyltransferase involved in cell wall biosynthesis
MGVEITIPAHNEEKILEGSITKLMSFLKGVNFKYNVTIVDSASKDKTLEIAKRLAKKYNKVRVVHLNKPGKGRAIKHAWRRSKQDLLCFMDADLSTDLRHLKEMVHLLKNYDIVCGDRLAKKSKVVRKNYRTLLSRFYNGIVRYGLNIKIEDIQCGFKGIRRKVFLKLVKDAKNNDFFFDTELIVWAEKRDYKVKEIPVHWKEGGQSKVNIIKTVRDFLTKVYYLRGRLRNKGLL